MYRIAIDGKTDIGRRREENEDALFWSGGDHTPFSFMIVADGMGGYHGGSIASQLAVNSINQRLSALQNTFDSCTPNQKPLILKSEVFQAIQDANQAILNEKLSKPQLQQMGTTVVVAVIWENRLLVAHIGDSRAYQWDTQFGLRQLTRDHSVVQQMIDTGRLTEEDARTSNVRNQLTQALGVNPNISPEISEHHLSGNCLLLLCSDGMTEYFANHEIEHVLSTHRPSLECCYRFIEESNQKGGKDNITVAIAEYTSTSSVPASPSPSQSSDSDNTVPYFA